LGVLPSTTRLVGEGRKLGELFGEAGPDQRTELLAVVENAHGLTVGTNDG
jgi:hypothetical protein